MQSNSRVNSDFAGGTVSSALTFAVCLVGFFPLAGGRKEAEVAGRAGTRDVIGAGAVRNVEDTRPAAVAGRAGRTRDVFSGRAEGIGAPRAALPRFKVEGVDCFTCDMVTARGRDGGTVLIVPVFTRTAGRGA